MAQPNNPKPYKGKKSKSWMEDPIILNRLIDVEDLHLANWSNRKIAIKLDVSEATIRRDIKRIAILWREEVTGIISELRARSIKNIRRIGRNADEQFKIKPDPSWLRIQMDGESLITRLQGTIMPKELIIQLNQKVNNPYDIKQIPTEELLRRAAESQKIAEKLMLKLENREKLKLLSGHSESSEEDEK